MATVKQVIVIRKDLNMPVGKLAAQVAHASMSSFLKHFSKIDENLIPKNRASHDKNVERWMKKGSTKVCLKVNSEQELLDVFQACKDAKIPNALIRDAGHTVFPEPTLTCLGIGPFNSDKIDKVTGHLKLYR